MKAIQVKFLKEKVAAQQRISGGCLTDLTAGIDQTTEDFMSQMFTMHLVAKIYANTVEERKLEYHCPRPTFLDWLLRRRRKVVFDFKAKDLLTNPPANFDRSELLRVYEISKESN